MRQQACRPASPSPHPTGAPPSADAVTTRRPSGLNDAERHRLHVCRMAEVFASRFPARTARALWSASIVGGVLLFAADVEKDEAGLQGLRVEQAGADAPAGQILRPACRFLRFPPLQPGETTGDEGDDGEDHRGDRELPDPPRLAALPRRASATASADAARYRRSDGRELRLVRGGPGLALRQLFRRQEQPGGLPWLSHSAARRWTAPRCFSRQAALSSRTGLMSRSWASSYQVAPARFSARTRCEARNCSMRSLARPVALPGALEHLAADAAGSDQPLADPVADRPLAAEVAAGDPRHRVGVVVGQGLG